MRAWPTELIFAIWVTWFVFWRLAARGAKPVEAQESVGSRLSYLLPMLVVIALLGWQDWPGWLGIRLFDAGWAGYWVSVALIVSGLAWTVWGRKALGDNWSGRVSVKSGHELVRSGPFRFVRHPIYAGALLALLGSALASGTAAALLALPLALMALIHKLRIEERMMLGQFGEQYRDYQRVSWALVPFIY